MQNKFLITKVQHCQFKQKKKKKRYAEFLFYWNSVLAEKSKQKQIYQTAKMVIVAQQQAYMRSNAGNLARSSVSPPPKQSSLFASNLLEKLGWGEPWQYGVVFLLGHFSKAVILCTGCNYNIEEQDQHSSYTVCSSPNKLSEPKKRSMLDVRNHPPQDMAKNPSRKVCSQKRQTTFFFFCGEKQTSSMLNFGKEKKTQTLNHVYNELEIGQTELLPLISSVIKSLICSSRNRWEFFCLPHIFSSYY